MFKLYHWLTNFDEMILLLIFYKVRESIEFQPPKKKIPLTQNKEDTHGVSDTDMNSRCPWLLMEIKIF